MITKHPEREAVLAFVEDLDIADAATFHHVINCASCSQIFLVTVGSPATPIQTPARPSHVTFERLVSFTESLDSAAIKTAVHLLTCSGCEGRRMVARKLRPKPSSTQSSTHACA